MIDPADRLISTYRDGDQRDLGSPTGGPDGEIPYVDYDAPEDKEPRMFRAELVTLGVSPDSTKVDAGDRPEYWSLSGCTVPPTNTEVWVWCADAASGPPHAILTGNGTAKISGIHQRLWLESRGLAGCRILVRAVRGYDHAESSYGG